jgi:formylmethanofuran--tetrahydromethanopterin N-formyltransferase
MSATIDDTYAEAFRSIYSEILITAKNRKWLDHAIAAATGNASSTIMCDCEAGLDRYVGPGGDQTLETPDARPGALVQFHVPRFKKDRVESLGKSLLMRVSQNILTCPTTAVFSISNSNDWLPIGKKIAFFGDGYQRRDERFGRKVWIIPILGGEFVIDRRFYFQDGLMGGNLWFMGSNQDSALQAAERACAAASSISGVICPFPGGIAASGSKAGSRYKFAIASTYAEYCPTLREVSGLESRLPSDVESVMELIINGRDLNTLVVASQAAIKAAIDTPGLIKISAGNYGGRLGKSFIYLNSTKQPAIQS